MSKKCFKCGCIKPRNQFYRHPHMRDGRLNKCKDCAKKEVREHRRISDSVREYDRRRYYDSHERRKQIAETAQAWREKNKAGYRAHILVKNAVRTGKLIRGVCEFCGTDKNIHAHHDNYSEPLNIRWLCVRHHAQLHAGIISHTAA